MLAIVFSFAWKYGGAEGAYSRAQSNFLPPSVREVSPNGDERSFEQSKNFPRRLTPTASSPRGLKKIADFTLAADKNRPNGNLFGLFSSFNSRKKDGCAGFFTP